MGEDELENTKKAIKLSGFPLELFVSSKLSKYDQSSVNQYFFDSTGAVARSIDFFVPHFVASEGGIGFSSNLVIECKKSSKDAWVFYELNGIIHSQLSGQLIDYENYLTGDYEKMNVKWKLNFSRVLHYNANTKSKMSRQFNVINKGAKSERDIKSKNSIFEALNQILKFIEYRTKKAEKNIANRFLNGKVRPIFMVYYPVIVFDGLLVNAFLDNNEELKIEKIKHVVLSYDYQPDYCENPQTFYVDIVQKDYFEEFLKILEEESNMINRQLKNNEGDFKEHCSSMKLTNPRTWSA